MKYALIIFFLISFFINIEAQDSFVGSEEWTAELYMHGVEMTDDSIHIGPEVLRLLSDKEYNHTFYSNQANWPKTLEYIKSNDLKKATWNMINLYMTNDYSKDKVVKSVLTYNTLFDMEKILISAFYTYCYTDPAIGYIEEGKPVIVAPHILEEKLQAVKEIIAYINQLDRSHSDRYNH